MRMLSGIQNKHINNNKKEIFRQSKQLWYILYFGYFSQTISYLPMTLIFGQVCLWHLIQSCYYILFISTLQRHLNTIVIQPIINLLQLLGYEDMISCEGAIRVVYKYKIWSINFELRNQRIQNNQA